MTTSQRRAKRPRAQELADSLKDKTWLGCIVTWSSGQDGKVHKHSDVIDALTKANLDPSEARELAPRNAFARAARQLSEERVIDVFKENETELVFQFTKKHLNDKQWEFDKEAFVVLNKITGQVTCEDSDLASSAQQAVDDAMEARTTIDITNIVKRLYDRHSDLIPLRDAGGVYFVPQEHAEFNDRVDLFLSTLGGRLDRIPIPAGTDSGDKAIQNAVSNTMEDLIEKHMTAVKSFEVNTRKDTIERAADKIKSTRIKIEAYASYLGDRQQELVKKVQEANKMLKEQVEAIGGGKPAYSQYEWDEILDGKIHKLEQGTDYQSTAASLLTRARAHAKRQGLRIRSNVLDKGKAVVLQALPADTEA